MNCVTCTIGHFLCILHNRAFPVYCVPYTIGHFLCIVISEVGLTGHKSTYQMQWPSHGLGG